MDRVQAMVRFGTWQLDIRSGDLQWSAETYRIFNLSPAEPVSIATFRDRIHPEDVQRLDNCWAAALKGQRYEVIHRILAGDELKWVRQRAELSFDEAGAPIYALGVTQDITAQKVIETELRERYAFEQLVSRISSRFVALTDFDAAVNASLAELGQFTQAHRAHVFRFDQDGMFFHNTHEWCAEGIDSELPNSQNLAAADYPWWIKQLASRTMINLARLDDLPSTAVQERRICEQQRIEALLAIPVFTKDRLAGTVGLESIGHARVWSESQVRALKVFAEIFTTALLRAQTEHRAHDLGQRLASTLETMTDAFFMLDRDWRFTFVNGEAERLLERGRAELLGQELWEAFVPARDTVFEREYRRAVRESCSVAFDAFYPPLERWFEVRAYPSEAGLAVYFCDITARRTAAAEREELAAKLRQSQKLEAIGRLAGGVAHDFNNMLNLILGHADLLLGRLPDNDPLREPLLEIRAAGQRSADLTRQLLTFARRQTIDPQVLDLNQTIGGMLKMLKRLIGEGVELRWLPAPDLPAVKMDPTQIDQILINLLVNARDAMAGAGSLLIETAVAQIDDSHCAANPELVPGQYVLLRVRDHGHGMDEVTRARIFEPFFTTRPQGEGTGLGMATVYGIVSQNRGMITVESEPGAGATFSIYLPATAAQIPDRGAAADKEPPPGSGTILLVEDEASLKKLIHQMLEQLGYQVLAAGSPEEALQIASSYQDEISLLLTDVVMPGMSGRELSQRLAELRPGLRCVYMSGYTADIIAPHGVLEPGLHFIQKPFRSKALAECLAAALAAR